jgi:HAD superfamily hydrolase (TIGR01549 family)
MQIRGLIFDLDGTLTDTHSVCVAAFRRAIEPLSTQKFSDAEIIATFGPSEEGTIQALIPGRYEEGLTSYLAHYALLLDDSNGLFGGIREVLTQIQLSGVRLGLVTGKGPKSTAITLRRFDFGDYFSDVETGSPKGSVKSLRIQDIIERWKLDCRDVAYIGDAPSDIAAARSAGVWMVAAAWSPEADVLALRALQPDVLLTTTQELNRWFVKHVAK